MEREEQGYANHEDDGTHDGLPRDLLVEEPLKAGAGQHTKKPHVDITTDSAPARQGNLRGFEVAKHRLLREKRHEIFVSIAFFLLLSNKPRIFFV